MLFINLLKIRFFLNKLKNISFLNVIRKVIFLNLILIFQKMLVFLKMQFKIHF